MKKTLATLAALLITTVSYGQGQVDLNNRVVGDVVAPITLPGGAGPGAGYTAQLLLVNGTSTTPVTPSTIFRTDSAAAQSFIVDPGVGVNIPGTQPGDTVTLRMIAFNGTAYGSPTTTFQGKSTDFTVKLGGGTLPPASLIGLTAFGLQAVPEPSTIALGVLGLGALLIRRRK